MPSCASPDHSLVGEGEPHPPVGREKPKQLLPVSWTTAVLCSHAVQRAHDVLEFHVRDIFPKNHGEG